MAEKEAKSKAAANGGSAGGNGPESSEFRSVSFRLIKMCKKKFEDLKVCTG